jgi:hypothetical protein
LATFASSPEDEATYVKWRRGMVIFYSACILVAACAGTIKEEMAKLEGQPLSTVIAKIGQPMGERSIAGKRVYYWGTPTPLSSKSDRGPQCQIQATMNGDVVERLAYEGDEALCLKYAARLRS